MSFLDKDGYINVAEIVALAKDIDKLAVREGLKPTTVYFCRKSIVRRDHPSAKKLDAAAFEKKRAQLISERSRPPAAGARMPKMVLLRNYKGLDSEEYSDFYNDYLSAVKAIEQHNKKAEKVIARLKAGAAKKRDRVNAEFDKNIKCFIEEVLPEDVDFAIGQSMMGKTVIVKLPNGGYVSIGKADKEKFLNAKNASKEGRPAKKAKSVAVRSKKARSRK